MQINEVAQITGLSKKAIRLYEEKGLIQIERNSNTYREYDPENIKLLKQIKLFREIGISLTEIKLYRENLISLEDMLKRRIGEAEKDSSELSNTIRLCKSILENGLSENTDFSPKEDILFTEDFDDGGSVAIGIDIGTTTISACVVHVESKKIQVYSIPNSCAVPSENKFERLQNTELIICRAKHIINSFRQIFSSVTSIGFTGQMHGIVYTDENGKAVSNLISWQDGRGNEIYKDGLTYAEYISDKTGFKVASGYGLVTHFYNLNNNAVPKNAVSFCTVADMVAASLTKTKPAMHISNGASIGLFNLEKNEYDKSALEKLGISDISLPKVTDKNLILGEFEGIPVSVAIGDNQASFFGAVKDESDAVLLNYGTGSQVSVLSDKIRTGCDIETRPYIGGKYLLCGAALCGGKSYAMLESFFSKYVTAATGKTQSQYSVINNLAQIAYESKIKSGLKADTAFEGTRSNPEKRGSVTGISTHNFTPENLVLSFLEAMASELYEMYKQMNDKPKKYIACSGNAVQKNPVFKKILTDFYEMPLKIPTYKEEAALGAAMYSLLCIGTPLEKIKDIVTYM